MVTSPTLKCLRLSLLIVGAALFGSVPAQAGGPLGDRLRYGLDPLLSVQMNLRYGPDKEEVADVVKHALWNNKRAVILIHGGGWSEGDKLDYSEEARRLARAGFTVININYRLGRVGAPSTYWPAQVVDAQLAVRWTRRFAKQLGIDPARICAEGASAGGHLALWLGIAQATLPGDRAALFQEQSSRVQCVANVSGPANLTHPAIAPRLLQLPFLGTTEPVEAMRVLRDASPLFRLNRQTAPTLILAGREDDVVPPALTRELAKALEELTVPHVYREMDGGHGLIGTPADQKSAAEDLISGFLKHYLLGKDTP